LQEKHDLGTMPKTNAYALTPSQMPSCLLEESWLGLLCSVAKILPTTVYALVVEFSAHWPSPTSEVEKASTMGSTIHLLKIHNQ